MKKRRLFIRRDDQKAQYEEKIKQLETELSIQKERAMTHQKQAARYRTLYYNLLRRYQAMQEDT